jgi:ABC-type nitrate/sulfonate/bicarbonate transport system substrate-binding protein
MNGNGDQPWQRLWWTSESGCRDTHPYRGPISSPISFTDIEEKRYRHMKRKARKTSVILTTASTILLIAGCGRSDPSKQEAGPLRLGFMHGPHAAPLYVAEKGMDTPSSAFNAIPLQSSGTIGYALIAGEIDVGFVETTKAASLFRAVTGLQAVGAITFPYGASLVLRKDLDLRIDEMAGRTVAVAGRRCRLLHQFLADIERFRLNRDAITLVSIPFDQMIPALEARKVDAILTRGGHALLALAQDHNMIYQNWDVKGDDECCPQTLAQVELVLVTRTQNVCPRKLATLLGALQAASAVPSDISRTLVSERTRIPLAILDDFPVASFVPLSPEQQAELGSAATIEEEQEMACQAACCAQE